MTMPTIPRILTTTALCLAAVLCTACQRNESENALLAAASQGQTQYIQSLLGQGTNANAEGEGGLTPLHLASQAGHTEAVRLLLEFGANPNAVADSYGQTPLWLAAINNHANIIRLLMAAGADATQISGRAKITPLMVAAERGYTDAVKALIDGGADVNHMIRWERRADKCHMTALSMLCYRFGDYYTDEHLNAARVLLAAGANPVLPPDSGAVKYQPICGAYRIAVANGKTELLQTLLDAGGLMGIEKEVMRECMENQVASLAAARQACGPVVPELPTEKAARELLTRYIVSQDLQDQDFSEAGQE